MAARSVQLPVQGRARAVQESSHALRACRRAYPICRSTRRGTAPLFQPIENVASPSGLPWTSLSVGWHGSERDFQGKQRSWHGREVSHTMCEMAVTGRKRDVTGSEVAVTRRERDVTGSEVAVFWKDLQPTSGNATTTAPRYIAREPAEMVTATRFVDRRNERAGTGSGQLG
jgi:hypothetical protein